MSTLPLTAAQLGIWLGQAKQSCDSYYNTAEYLKLDWEVDTQRWLLEASRALQGITALNVKFQEQGGEPQQILLSNAERSAKYGEYVDFSEQENAPAAAQHFLNDWYRKPYHLAAGELYRHVLIKLAPRQYLWALGAHHIAMDGYSFALAGDRVLAAYEGRPVTDDAAQYRELVVADVNYQRSEHYQQDKEFWLAHLRGASSAIQLTDNTLQVEAASNKVSAVLSAQLQQKLVTQAQRQGASWPELLIAAISYLVYQSSGAAETIIGTPVANRIASKAANTPCMHMNIIPLKVQFHLATDFADLVTQVSQQLRQARRHFRFRYEEIKAQSQAHNLPSKLFGPVVNILPFERQQSCSGYPVSSHTISAGPVEDIAFVFATQADGSLLFEIEANPSGYSMEQLKALQTQSLTLLQQFESQLQQPLTVRCSDLALYHQQGPLPFNSVLSSLLQQVRQRPEALALRNAQGRELSYAELYQQVRALAQGIQALQQASAGTVAVALPRSPETIVAIWAVLAAGQRFVCIDDAAPAARNSEIIADATPFVALVNPQTAASVSVIDSGLPLLDASDLPRHSNSPVEGIKVSPEQHAYLIYTSGSTGQPKGVQISHAALAGFVHGARECYGIGPADRVLQFAPFHFDTCIEEIFVTHSSGAALVLRSDAMLSSFSAFMDEIDEQQITVLDLPTAYWHELCHYLCRSGRFLPKRVHTLIIGGEAVNSQRVQAWQAHVAQNIRLLNTYGPTEATVVATAVDLSHTTVFNLIGKPLAGRGAVVMREPGQVAKLGEQGELWLTGVGLASGYLNQQQQSDHAFVEVWDPLQRAMVAAYRTGNRVIMDKAGQLTYLGRGDAQIKISGYRIEIGEIEATLLALPEVLEAAITVIHNSQGAATALAAHLVATQQRTLSELRAELAQQLPAVMIPSQVYHHAALPKTAANKLDRSALSAHLASTPKTQLTGLQADVAAVWQAVLGVADVHPDDNFFDIGGQSMQCIQVAARLTELCQQSVTVAFLFAHPKLADLCTALAKGSDVSPTSHDQLQATIMQDVEDVETQLQAIQPSPTLKQPTSPCVLLTGATGFVGAQLLAQLLLTANVTILCPVRADNLQHGLARLQQALAAQQLGELDQQRVEVLVTDIAKPNLGLSACEYDALGRRITHVLHNAAQTSVLRDYASLRSANVLVTAQLLKFAKQFALPFSHVSTIAVAPQQEQPLEEQFVAFHPGLRDGYQQSKWAAEAMVAKARKQGVKVQVYRLARVIGASHSGFINRDDLVWRILRAGLKRQQLPELKVSEPWTPVDTIAQFMVRQTLQQSGHGVYNLTPETQVCLPQLYQWLQQYGFKLHTLAVAKWVQQLEHSDDEHDLAIASFFSSQDEQAQPVKLEAKNQRFVSASRKFAIHLPTFRCDDLSQYLVFAFRVGLLNPRQHPQVVQKLKQNHLLHEEAL